MTSLHGMPILASISPPRARCKIQSDRRGNIAIMSALLAPVLLGTFGLGPRWRPGTAYNARSERSTRGDRCRTNGSTNFPDEAKAVTSRVSPTVRPASWSPRSRTGGPSGWTNDAITSREEGRDAEPGHIVAKGDTTVNRAPAIMLSANRARHPGSRPGPVHRSPGPCGGRRSEERHPYGRSLGRGVLSNTDAVCNGHTPWPTLVTRTERDGCGLKPSQASAATMTRHAARASNIRRRLHLPTIPKRRGTLHFPSGPVIGAVAFRARQSAIAAR